MIRHSRALAIRQVAARRDISTLYRDLADNLRGMLLRYSDPDGTIPLERLRDVRTAAAPLIMRYFVGLDGRNAYRDDKTPLSPFADLLNRHIARVTYDVVIAHTRYLRRQFPLDILNWLRQPRRVIEQLDIIQRNPLARYEHSHEWVDSRGYTLSDRIWAIGTETRRKLDLVLAEGIRNGDSAVAIGRRIERFLLPERADFRTPKPYGADGSFDALRLIRSEITLAHSRAALAAAEANPLVIAIDWRLSPAHPRIDICDPIAAGSPYEVAECPIPVQDSHPHCLCHLAPRVGDTAGVIEALREAIGRGELPELNAGEPRSLLRDLLEETLFSLLLQGLSPGEINELGLALDVAFGTAINRVEF